MSLWHTVRTNWLMSCELNTKTIIWFLSFSTNTSQKAAQYGFLTIFRSVGRRTSWLHAWQRRHVRTSVWSVKTEQHVPTQAESHQQARGGITYMSAANIHTLPSFCLYIFVYPLKHLSILCLSSLAVSDKVAHWCVTGCLTSFKSSQTQGSCL